jgi:hypothetical protein
VDLIADTTFLVGLWRKQPWAVDFARSNRQRILGIPWVVLGEFWNGAKRAGHDDERVRKFLSTGLPIGDAAPVVPFYAAVCFQAQEDGFYSAIGHKRSLDRGYRPLACAATGHAKPSPFRQGQWSARRGLVRSGLEPEQKEVGIDRFQQLLLFPSKPWVLFSVIQDLHSFFAKWLPTQSAFYQ